MTTTCRNERDALIQKSETDMEKWSGLVDTLLHAFHNSTEAPPSLGSKMEALRNKRDTAATKVQALKRHRDRDWSKARDELTHARQELRQAWRSVIGTLDKESLYA